MKVETRVEFDERVEVDRWGPPGPSRRVESGRRDDQWRGPALDLGAPARGLDLVADRREGARVAVVSLGGPAHPVGAGAGPGPGRPPGAPLAPADEARRRRRSLDRRRPGRPEPERLRRPGDERLEATLESVDEARPGSGSWDDPGRGAGGRGLDGLRRVVHLRPEGEAGSAA